MVGKCRERLAVDCRRLATVLYSTRRLAAGAGAMVDGREAGAGAGGDVGDEVGRGGAAAPRGRAARVAWGNHSREDEVGGLGGAPHPPRAEEEAVLRHEVDDLAHVRRRRAPARRGGDGRGPGRVAHHPRREGLAPYLGPARS
eukprot:gene5871-biopygen5817